MKYRLVPEEELLDLLRDSHKLACLDWDGVDNWHGYMESFDEYIAMHLKETKQYKDRPTKELVDIVIDENFDFGSLAEIDIEAYSVINAIPASRLEEIDDYKVRASREGRSKCDIDWSGLPESLSEPDSYDSWGGFKETGSVKVDPDPDGWGGLQGGL